MFDCTGLPNRDWHDDATDEQGSEGTMRPMEFVVRKDGKPFAILNATPAMARNTVAGFRRAVPGVSWSVDRV